MLKPISRELTQDHPVPAAAKGSSWFWHPPLADPVNKVALQIPAAMCYLCPFPTQKRGSRESRSLKNRITWSTGAFICFSNHWLPILQGEKIQSWICPKDLQLSYDNLSADRQTQIIYLRSQWSPQRHLSSPNHWYLWTAIKSSPAYINDRTFLLAEAP